MDGPVLVYRSKRTSIKDASAEAAGFTELLLCPGTITAPHGRGGK